MITKNPTINYFAYYVKKNTTIVTEEQLLLLAFLNKYNQMFYKFSDYNNYSKWLEDEERLDKAMDAVMSGSYVDDDSVEKYINDCILDIEQVENN